jgi:catechol 2,3-dioxygenase-like lactoylglutathione lyase family enzyme
MRLSDCRVSPQIAVSNIAAAEEFYEGKLGLEPKGQQYEGTRSYGCGNGTSLHIYAAPGRAGATTATVARWDVNDIVAAVEDLKSRGVTFEHYDEPVKTDAQGIHDSGYGKVAWFKDPDGNTFSLEQV